ncbi:hypothetical protein ADL12_08790 [Streptomyces regalis]|uniref:Uncharacterized protein n=1 Tax=Streptomyces regalis TaxID=68262 RepID=A0A0X3VF22_9ACTN|nr:hypothetical protein ADL12_08790 [Streptomyces regalis]
MADIAATALRLGRPTTSGPVDVADVWINGDIGFVLLLHRRHDGLPAEELYYSLRAEDGTWERPDHLSGGLIGLEVSDRSAVAEALAGAPMAVVTESESLVHTGRGRSGDRDEEEDEGELVHFWELLVTEEADLLEIEHMPQDHPAQTPPPSLRREVTGRPLMLVALLPGERVRVHAMRREGTSLIRLDGALDLHSPGE